MQIILRRGEKAIRKLSRLFMYGAADEKFRIEYV